MRHPGQLKSLASLITAPGTHLEILNIEASIQAKRAEKIHQVIPVALSGFIHVGDLTHGLLTLYVPTAAVATKLRFTEANLLKILAVDPLFRGLRRIQCRIRPIKKNLENKQPKKRIHSKNAAKILLDYSESLGDPRLKRQFQRLAGLVSGNLEPDQK